MTVNCTNTSSLSLEENSHKKRRTIPQKSESELVKIFWGAPIEAFFGQETVAPVVDCSTKTLECHRWRGIGISFRKVNGRVLYP